MSAQRSVGQGNLRSPLTLRPAGSSVVQRLVDRSVSGRGLDVRVHQHFGWRLHLEWQTEDGRRHCCERFFTSFRAVDKFCAELTRAGAEGVCACVGDWPDLFEGKVRECRLEPTITPLPDISRYWIKIVQESGDDARYKCLCPVSSTEWVIDDVGWRTRILRSSSSSSTSS